MGMNKVFSTALNSGMVSLLININIANDYTACHSAFMTKPSPACIAANKGQRINGHCSKCSGKA